MGLRSIYLTWSFWREFGSQVAKSTVDMGVRTGSAIKEGVLAGSDIILYGVAEVAGYGEEYQGQSKIFQDIYKNPQNYDENKLRSDILFGTVKTVGNLATFGAVSGIEGGIDLVKGDYKGAQDNLLVGVLMASGGALKESGGFDLKIKLPEYTLTSGETAAFSFEFATVTTVNAGNVLATSAQGLSVMMCSGRSKGKPGELTKNPDDYVPVEGEYEELKTKDATEGRHRQWKNEKGETTKKWDKSGREAGKDRGPHWHDANDPKGIKNHIELD